ncbi:hypothetical protein P43SY_001910 [Pythium insidiosum]|uniref:MARVEL domain-containing protein n=1 Tax=Pythium insidiosum TaxID=114742 RepID=A0AAD5Q6C3_PYTIN|nr:hypothetical protein P43SY_001910 [Pythium insidiosum]
MLNAQQLQLICLAARGLQLLSAVIALSTIATGVVGGAASRSSVFAILVNYTVMLYSAYVVVGVEALNRAPRLPAMVEAVIDGCLAAALFLAGIMVATWEVYENCDQLNRYTLYNGLGKSFNCGNLTAGIVFSFVGMGALIGTLAMTIRHRLQNC